MNDKKQIFDLIISGGMVVLPELKLERLDIGILDSKIISLGDLSKFKSKNLLDIKDLIVMPGVIDTQVHFREPGLTHKEDIFHGTKSAVMGGVTSIFEMPNTVPPTTTEVELKRKFEIAAKNAHCNYSFFAGASKDNITFIDKLECFPGCCGVKIFMGSSTGDLLVEDDDSIIQILKRTKKMIAVHSEDEYRLNERKETFLKKEVSVFNHPEIRDVASAVQSTKRLLNSAKLAKKKIHILHLSTSDEVDLLAANKKIATCEATPQHLFFSAPECYENLGTFAQMNPPIRDKKHQDKLWYGISKGVIDVIGSDHAPHTIKEKKKLYPNSPSGMTGVQTLLPIMLDFVNKGKLSIFDLVRLVCTNPCKIYDIYKKGQIKIGYDADLTVIDLKKEFVISNSWIQSKSKWTPYDNYKIKGMPIFTIVNGEITMAENEIITSPIGQVVKFNN